ncbi:MAG: Fe2+-dependent dioxygenase [Pseudomonadota bacterium]
MNYLIIENVLPPDLLLEITNAISQGPFDNGKSTANGLAKTAKKNLQLSAAAHGELLHKIGQVIESNAMVRSFALPHKISRLILNRYEKEMDYGLHSDGAYIDDVRTDISFTLFLDDPSTYEGGELVIATASQQFTFKLPAGRMVIYPTGALHRVTPVTHGVRNALVGWIQSRIKDAAKREIIAKLNLVPNTLSSDEKYRELATLTGECIQNLVRMWGE